eukprot:CFRG5932T1
MQDLAQCMSTASMDDKAATSTGQFKKRDALISLEFKAQKKWDDVKLFESDAPATATEEFEAKNKYLCTFPYPYMNGRLHLGHSFSLSKCEFSMGFERLQGKRTLFPFGFHCTGMPIKACADKLKREMELFGCPPQFPTVETVAGDGVVKKSKIAAKEGKATYQWEIMQSSGVPDEEIKLFADPQHWLNYFPPHAITDLKRLGLKVDWRRSFITTPANPYYDSFIRWQFETLNDLGKIKFGKRHTIYSPADGQPCMDHDRQSGEGVGTQEYTLIKMKVITLPEKLSSLEGKKVYLVAGTLRPETMYGQTNCWVRPDMEYGAYDVGQNEIFICAEHCAKNLAYQGKSPEFGVASKVLDLVGMDIMGTALEAPLTSYEKVYTLPMLNIKADKGSGIVTSVPSDSPDDYATLRDLKNKEPLRAKYGITDEMVLPFDVLPVIHIDELGDMAAVVACDKFKIRSQNDAEALAKAKDLVYLKGFYEGVLLVGDFKGDKVADAKPKVRQQLIDQGLACSYFEPESEVMSRSGDKCVVALVDQWYIDYGEDMWKAQCKKLLEGMETYSLDTRNNFNRVLDWLHEWACSRSFGLGSRLPWDPQYLIESLSDSTIYMAYYTVAHLLHDTNLTGSGTPPLGIKPEDMTRKAWDYVYLGGDYPTDCAVPEEKLSLLRAEFQYWYPVDLRVSGKDLVPNHLTFFLYTHAAMWGDKYFPKGVRANGHLMLNKAKMSKSTGNFMTLSDAIRDFGADMTRFTLADAGDSMEDANFESATVNSAILRLYTQLEWTQSVLNGAEASRTGENSTFHDKVFESAINTAINLSHSAYSQMLYREALKVGFYDLQNARNAYVAYQSAEPEGLNLDLLRRFIETQALLLSPFCPHYAEEIWELLGNDGLIMNARWPQAGVIDKEALKGSQYIEGVVNNMRTKLAQVKQPKKGKPMNPTKMKLVYTDEYPEWQREALTLLSKLYNEDKETYENNKKIVGLLKAIDSVKPYMKKVMVFVHAAKEDCAARGPIAFTSTVTFPEGQILGHYKNYISKAIAMDLTIECVNVGSSAEPMKPYLEYSE